HGSGSARGHSPGARHELAAVRKNPEEAMRPTREIAVAATAAVGAPRQRRGFTITELLVAMALIVFIMYVLSEAFSAGAGAVRNLKAIGDMNEQLRSAGNIMRRYLAADHFDGKARLSDPDFWKDGPRPEGFFRIYQGTKGTYEGLDLDGLESWRATDHMLHF